MVHVHGSSCDGHNHGNSTENIGLAFFLNLTFACIELISGIIFNSTALIADSIHDAGDSLNIGMSYILEKFSKTGRKKGFTYGFKRLSVIGASINSAILFISSIVVISFAIPRILSPQEVNFQGVFFIALIGITINGIAYLKTKGGDNLNQKAISWHMFEDTLGWFAVLISAIINFFIPLPILDPLLALFIACFIGYNIFKNLKNLVNIFLQATPIKLSEEDIVRSLKEIPEILGVHDVHLWTLDNESHVATLHIQVDENIPSKKLSQIKKISHLKLGKIGISHVTVEFDFGDQNCSYSKC